MEVDEYFDILHKMVDEYYVVYKVKLRESALRDLADLRVCLKRVMSREGAHRYVSPDAR